MAHKKLLLVAGVAAALSSAACDNSKLTDINKNPNSPTDAPPGPVFTRAANLAGQSFLGSGYDQYYLSVVAQHLAEIQYPDVDSYKRLDPASTGTPFNNAYSGEIEDLSQIIRRGKAANNPSVWGPASVLRAWEFEIITDSWGDVPYFSSNQGDSATVQLFPVYDKQQVIYADLFKTLDTASKAMATANTALVGLGTADIIYKGNLTRWQKLANSLRARLAMRVINVDAALANTQLAAAFAAPGGVFTSNAEAASIVWPGDNVYNNPWGGDLARDDRRVSASLINPLIATADPRLAVYAQPTVADPTKYVGLVNGRYTQDSLPPFVSTTSRVGKALFTASTSYGNFGIAGIARPSYIMTYAELSFIQAEAAQRGVGGLTAGQAAGFYQNGIRSSMTQWGIADAATTTFLARPDIAYQSGSAGLIQIATQKWIALFGDGGQAWMEWRRTCVPANLKAGVVANFPAIPRRLLYPTTEYSTNADQVAKAVANQGADAFPTRTWWDTAPQASVTGNSATCGTR